jgi:hypothetical protein
VHQRLVQDVGRVREQVAAVVLDHVGGEELGEPLLDLPLLVFHVK